MKSASSNNTAKHALSLVIDDITTVPSAVAIPRGKQQVNDIHKKVKTQSTMDLLFTLMMMCKEEEASKSANVFVWIVTEDGFPMMVWWEKGVGNFNQLKDIVVSKSVTKKRKGHFLCHSKGDVIKTWHQSYGSDLGPTEFYVSF